MLKSYSKCHSTFNLPPLEQIIDTHMLVTLATAGAIALEDYVEAAAVVVLFAVAEHWERCSTDKVTTAGKAGAWAAGSVCLPAPWGPVPAVEGCRLPGRPPGQRGQLRGAPCGLSATHHLQPCLQARDAVAAVLKLRPETGASGLPAHPSIRLPACPVRAHTAACYSHLCSPQSCKSPDMT